MKKVLSYILTPIFLLAFALILLVFHGIQWICLKLGGYRWHKKSVDYLNFFLLKSLLLLGVPYKLINPHSLPEDKPLIFVSNHQSLFDISPFIWYFRKHHVKFVAKKELAKGFPSISFNLRHGGNVMIDRKNPEQAIPAIEGFAKYIEKNKFAAVIFPEGTRSRNGIPKRFSSKGLKKMLENAPSAMIIPVTLNNAWKVSRYGLFPMGVGEQITLTVHEPLAPQDRDFEEMFAEMEEAIKSAVLI